MSFRDSSQYRTSLAFLMERLNYEKTTQLPYTQQHYRLNRMRRLLELLGNPHLAAPVLHIAGTKGKGSVAWMLAESLRHSGYRTGLYTSPHLIHIEERFVVDGQACSPEELVEITDQLREPTRELSKSDLGAPTFFELTTAIGWLLFRKREVDVSVIEVGLGGRLDSTNICAPLLTIITSISFDHQHQLGNTLREIATEKGGIIKKGVPVVSGVTALEAAEVIQKISRDNESPLWELGRDFFIQWMAPPSRTPEEPQGERKAKIHFSWNVDIAAANGFSDRHPELYELGLMGEHQSLNAALVCASVDILRVHGWEIPESALAKSLCETQILARLQLVSTSPWIIIDTAHNVASIHALVETLERHFSSERRILVFSASKDKEYAKMLRYLMKFFDTIVLTQFQSNPRAVPLPMLQQIAQEVLDGEPSQFKRLHSVELPEVAIRLARSFASSNDLICITGSFFLASEALQSPSLNGGAS